MSVKQRFSFNVQGLVQGVGFRPFVYTLAKRFSLVGFVYNDAQGVKVEIEGTPDALQHFENAFFEELPPLARIDVFQKEQIAPVNALEFVIVESKTTSFKSSLVLPDMSLCEACRHELNDPSNRRFNYFFINCTNCGPRYSIIKTVPYDRPFTSMEPFVMCEACAKEYKEPLDRRYHAQPISCPQCGPTLSLYKMGEKTPIAYNHYALEELASLIHHGHIVAMKGMGGFHLMCDATNETTVLMLRERKHRPSKPFAVMFSDVDTILEECEASEAEQKGLSSLLRPIVLLKRRKNNSKIAQSVAPNTDRLGVFLPYTPLHEVLFKSLKKPIIATSANRSGEPIISDADVLSEKLNHVIEYYLDYNRDIVHSSDDSVVQFVDDKQIMMRASRGVAPYSFRVNSSDERRILAVGAHQKNAIALYLNGQVIVSPFIGDLDNIATTKLFEQLLESFKTFYNFEPDLIVHDAHPNYFSTQWAKRQNVPLVSVQHHYAHVLACMAEHQLDEKVLGIAWDGTGYGEDGTIWGSECFVCDRDGYERVASLEPFPLLGGDASIKDIRRIFASVAWQTMGDEANTYLLEHFDEDSLKKLKIVYDKKINSPLCASMGRLFDLVAVICGYKGPVSYDGESGLWLETLYDENVTESYNFKLENNTIYYLNNVKEMLNDQNPSKIVSKFLNSLVNILLGLIEYYHAPIVLSGGVFQNRTLLRLITSRVPHKVYFQQQTAINDGGICIGQLYKVLQK